MKTLTFKYTKADGKVSDRVVLITAEPTKLYAGTDISSLDMQDQVRYIHAVQRAREDYLEQIKELNEEFDLNFNYRQFDPAKMSDIVTEDI